MAMSGENVLGRGHSLFKGSTVCGVLEEHRGGPYVWSRVSERERGKRGGQGADGWGQVM